ncbi:major facilitator superfamily domain-containing protein [Mucor lusitanicus]|uniref:Major facilitator superfamily domain-containing protein n=1 Tax=Mucor circinelloides f. lusitanicus TaxID=29924 RepID=A0A8H4EZE1_MUCCL|nr:major facilitator superfamily domain-containing protein [Mucor lusitanicus]
MSNQENKINRPIDSQEARGIRIAQASKLVSTHLDRIILFIGLLLMSWVISWEKNITNTITSTVSSLFQANNISGILGTVLSILQTALQPMYSKLSDMTGRATAYTFSVGMFILSFVIMACATNYNMLIGGQVIYSFGYSGVYILGPILIGDSVGLVNRTLILAVYNFPIIINLFAGGLAAQTFINSGQWRWGYGHICIVIFVASVPLLTVLWNLQYRAKKSGLLRKGSTKYRKAAARLDQENKTSFYDTLTWFISEIDLVGSLMLVAGLFLVLLPLILATSWGGWRSSTVIGCLVSGGVTWLLFGFWEWKMAVKPIIPLTHWKSKNPIWGTLTLFMIWTINNMMDLQYFLSYLQVTRRVSPLIASYLERGENCANVVLPILIGYFIRRTQRWRPFVWVGACLAVVGPGLMIPARRMGSPDVFIVMAQIIFGASSAFLNYPVLVGIQGSVPRKDVAIVTALFEVGVSVAGSIGSTIAGAVWNSVLPRLIQKYVPGDYNALTITKSIPKILALPKEQYNGVAQAYDEAMHILGIIAVCMGALAFICSTQLKGYILENRVPEEEESAGVENRDIDTTAVDHEDDESVVEQVVNGDNASSKEKAIKVV